MNFLDLPEHILEKTLQNLTYDEVEKFQLVSEGTKKICEQVLMRGIRKAIRTHSLVSERIEALLPQDKSARDNHTLEGHKIVLETIKNLLSSLRFAYSTYLHSNLFDCQPGRLLDEIFKILAFLSETRKEFNFLEVIKELLELHTLSNSRMTKLWNRDNNKY